MGKNRNRRALVDWEDLEVEEDLDYLLNRILSI